jgi:glycine dehydrogenase subunit 2
MSYSLLFEKSKQGRGKFRFPGDREIKPADQYLDASYIREEEPCIPSLSEVDVIRHYTNLSQRNYGVDVGFYPLGSCTMKYNPKINEKVAALAGFSSLHPLQLERYVQGTLHVMYQLLVQLSEITGMTWGTLQPFAGAHGELTGMKLFRAYFDKRGESSRRKMLVPDSAHGTNPASAHISGFDVVEVPSDEQGMVDVEALKEHLDSELAGIMLTNPNTLGIFEKSIAEIAELVHEAGGLLYYDGANINPILGKARPGDMGFDVVHLNLHKTFSTPHGGGGPGSGPIMVNKKLQPFLPVPDIVKEDEYYRWNFDIPDSLGRLSGFYGNVGVLIRAYTYLLVLGEDGLRETAEASVLNANYVKEALKQHYELKYDLVCKHEFVLSAKKLKNSYGIGAVDVAKSLLDNHIHPPTVYFPLIVPEAMMIEPTETESLETLNRFIEVMRKIAEDAGKDPQKLREAPISTPVRRVDEVRAAKHPVLRWKEKEE